jgi:hypothetical protein
MQEKTSFFFIFSRKKDAASIFFSIIKNILEKGMIISVSLSLYVFIVA